MVRLHRVEERQFLPGTTLEEAWGFFANPRNLPVVSPPELGLRVTSNPPQRVYPGLILTYRIDLAPRLHRQWVIEVTQVREGRLLVDEQRFGPFRMWHHEHHLAALEGGVEVSDIMIYAMPFDPLGSLVDALWLRRRLRRAFAFRRRVLSQRFGASRLATD